MMDLSINGTKLKTPQPIIPTATQSRISKNNIKTVNMKAPTPKFTQKTANIITAKPKSISVANKSGINNKVALKEQKPKPKV